MDSVEKAIIRMAAAQEQTTKNVDELRREFKGVIHTLSEIGVLDNKIASSHRRINELKADIAKLEKKLDDRNKLLVATLISAVGALIGVVFMFLKGG